MGGPAPGKYYIQLATGRQPRIGADTSGNLPVVAPVITDGRDNVVSPLVFVQHQLRSYLFNPRCSLCFPFLYNE